MPDYPNALAKIHMNVGACLTRTGKLDEARVEYERARDIEQKLAERFPDRPEYQLLLAGTHHNLGLILDDLGKPDAALGEYERARDIERKLAERFPAVPDYQQNLAHTHNNLANLLAVHGKRDEARGEHQQAVEIRQKLAAQFPASPGYQIDLGNSYSNFGSFILDDGKPAESLQWFASAITTLTAVCKQEPRDVPARENLRDGYQNRAVALDQLHRGAEAARDWDAAIELSDPSEQMGVRATRAASRVQAGQVAEAIGELAGLIEAGTWNARQWYDFACVYGFASGKAADKKQSYADRAMELLRRAVQAGFTNDARMARDNNLDPLRDRDDFKKLLVELSAGKDNKQKK